MPNPNNKSTLLLIDDEPDILETLSLMIEGFGYRVITAENCEIAKALLLEQSISMCLTDMRLPDGNGLEIIDYIVSNQPDIPVAVFTAHGNIELAVKCLQQGAFDFIAKPVKADDLKRLLDQGVKKNSSADSQPASTKKNKVVLHGNSEAINHVRNQIDKIAKSQAPVHITGSSGSGKELAAKLIHQQSRRFDEPFIAINCGAIPSELVESEFFGHKKGSFSGAISHETGLFRAANGGTLFLDEIADLPLDMQVKLLRVIQEKKVRPVGSTTEYDIDVRLVSATHQNLKQLVKQGSFRQDLFFRINVIPLTIPSLLERKEDLIVLCDEILNKIASQNGTPKTLSTKALNMLKHYSFPGNVRELENILERAYALSENDTIEAESLMLEPDSENNEPLKFQVGKDNINDYLEQTEKEAILSALEQTNGNKTKAAELLGISFRSLRHKLTKIDTP